MWSLGVCLYKMLTGSYPYSKEDIKNFQLINQEKTLTFPPSASPEVKSLVKKLLRINPIERLKI